MKDLYCSESTESGHCMYVFIEYMTLTVNLHSRSYAIISLTLNDLDSNQLSLFVHIMDKLR